MTTGRRTVTAARAYYIKLGRGGEWEAECLGEGTLRFGYRETPHQLCIAGEWDQVRDFWAEQRTDPGAAARDAKQIRAFYETDESGIFITFGMAYCTGAGRRGPSRCYQTARTAARRLTAGTTGAPTEPCFHRIVSPGTFSRSRCSGARYAR